MELFAVLPGAVAVRACTGVRCRACIPVGCPQEVGQVVEAGRGHVVFRQEGRKEADHRLRAENQSIKINQSIHYRFYRLIMKLSDLCAKS